LGLESGRCLVQLGGSVESEFGARLHRRFQGIALGPFGILGGQPVARQHVGSFVLPLLDGLGQPHVHGMQRCRVEAGDDGVANAIVVVLDHVRALPTSAPNQAFVHKCGDASFPCLRSQRDLRRAGQHPLWQGIASHGDHAKQALTLLGKTARPLENHAVQAERPHLRCRFEPTLRQHHCAQVMNELDGKKGMAARFANHRLDDSPLRAAGMASSSRRSAAKARVDSGGSGPRAMVSISG
jgi:hypothetical protein